MQKRWIVSSMWLGAIGFTGCASEPAGIEVRHSGGHVRGSSFQCTGTWPSSATPCQTPWESQPHTFAASVSSDVIGLTLGRVPVPIDGGASEVVIELTAGASGLLGATAKERTSTPVPRMTETSDASSGWIDPDAVSATADARNAGAFSLTFPWGTISGTYDTLSESPL